MRSPRRGRRWPLPLGGALLAAALIGPAAQAFFPPIRHDPQPPPYFPPPHIHVPPPPPIPQPPPNTPHNPPPTIKQTPEPGTLILGLIGAGIAGVVGRRKKKED